MKKILFAVITLFMFGSELAQAEGYPVFSASLGGGAGAVYTRRGVRRTIYRPGGYGYPNQVGVAHESYSLLGGSPNLSVINEKKYVLRYTKRTVEISKKEMERLKPIITHIRDKKVTSIDIVGIDKDPDLSRSRYDKLSEIFLAYNPSLHINYRSISGVAVFETNNHTIEIIEHY